MSRNRIGPYIERLCEIDDSGRYRLTFLEDFPSRLISETLWELRSLDPPERIPGTTRPELDYWELELADEVESVVRGDHKPADDKLNDQYFYTNFDFWKQHNARWMPPYPHRILLDSRITSAGNLSVRFRPECLGEDGRWTRAGEWRDIPFLGHSATMERPNDEVLFIRNVDRLLAGNLEHRRRHPGRREMEELNRINALCNAVNMAFWLVVHRLSNRFEVHIARYVTVLTYDTGKNCLGLDIVDALEDHRAEVESSFKVFRQQTGHDPQHFWDVCQETKVGWSFDRASKVLRGQTFPSAKLTPSVIHRYYDQLDRAIKYGFWHPKEPESAGFEPQAEEARSAARIIEVRRRRYADMDSALSGPSLPETRKVAAVRLERVGILPDADRARDPFAPPSYDGLRQATLQADVKAEFGMKSARELVDRLNAIWREQGRAPIPQGSFPTNAAKLKYVVAELRKALR